MTQRRILNVIPQNGSSTNNILPPKLKVLRMELLLNQRGNMTR